MPRILSNPPVAPVALKGKTPSMADSNPLEPPKGITAKTLQRLYQGPLEEFTPQRNEMAKSLRSDGDAAAANWVKGLKKPTRAAWLVNQLAATKAKDVRQLLEASAALRGAQEEMLAGATDQRKLRASARRERRAIDALTGSAEKIAGREDIGEQILTRVSETLQAAATDPAVAEAIEQGRLTREQRAASVGLIGTAAPAPRAASKKEAEREAAGSRNRRQQAKRRKAAERKLAAAEKRLERERAGLARALEKAKDAERRLHQAELDTNAARRELDAL
jgi:hypothetical protein